MTVSTGVSSQHASKKTRSWHYIRHCTCARVCSLDSMVLDYWQNAFSMQYLPTNVTADSNLHARCQHCMLLLLFLLHETRVCTSSGSGTQTPLQPWLQQCRSSSSPLTGNNTRMVNWLWLCMQPYLALHTHYSNRLAPD